MSLTDDCNDKSLRVPLNRYIVNWSFDLIFLENVSTTSTTKSSPIFSENLTSRPIDTACTFVPKTSETKAFSKALFLKFSIHLIHLLVRLVDLLCEQAQHHVRIWKDY